MSESRLPQWAKEERQQIIDDDARQRPGMVFIKIFTILLLAFLIRQCR